MNARLFRLLVICLTGSMLAGNVPGHEWPRFRGANGSGIGTANIPSRWTEKDYHWKVELPGVGHSSPVVWGERIFVTSAEEATGKRILSCLDTRDGKSRWSRALDGPQHGKHKDNSFASATPAVDDRHVYVSWASPKDYVVAAFDHDGKEQWRTDLGSFRSGHGFGASPIVHEDLVVVPNDQAGGALLGLERDTGKVRWKVPRRSKETYSTPCVYQKDGRAELLFTNYEHGITSVDPRTGKVNWELDVFDKRHIETCISSPILAGDLVLASSGWLGVRQEVVAVRLAAGGAEAKPREVYRVDRSAPLCTTPLVAGDLLFLWSDGGIVTCADVRTGEVHWRERVPGAYYGSPVCVGKCLFNISRDGEVVVLAAARQYELLARNRLGEGSHASPAVAGGRMYLRTFSHLISIGGK